MPASALAADLPCDGLVPVKFADFACAAAWLFCAAGVLHELPGRLHVTVGVGSTGAIVRPARLMLSMSMTAVPPPIDSCALPVQTFAAAGSAMLLTVKPAPVRHSRRLPPTVR